MADIEEFLTIRAKEGLLRTLKPVFRRGDGVIYFNKKEYIDFSSNDYLGLSTHPKLIREAKKATDEFGTSSSASRLLSGDSQLHHRLEEKIADFKNKEAALFFNSGYQANAGIISSLYGKSDCIIMDRLSHASLIDGSLLSQAKLFRFRHNDAAHLELILKKERDKFKDVLIITETVFSMDGDIAPLEELVRLKEKYKCKIFVDEAHATGIFGKHGSGIVEEAGLAEKTDFIMGTFSKGLGGFGAYLAASQRVVDYLINACRSFIYSTALPPAVIACNLASIELIREEPDRRKELLAAAGYFRAGLKELGFDVRGDSQIVPLILGSSRRAVEFAALIQKKGYWVLPIRPPAVPENEARLRFSLTTHHNKKILKKLVDDISRIRI